MKTKKDKKIDLRLTAKEKELIQEQAEKYRMTVSQYIRLVCEQWRICGYGLFQSSTDIEKEWRKEQE